MWGAVRLLSHRESLALAELKRTGHEVYAPRAIERRVIRRRMVETHPLLFPAYIFCATIAGQWHDIRWSPGVAGLVMAGATPTRVSEDIVQKIRCRENKGGLIELPAFRPGEKVRVIAGPLSGLEGILHAPDGPDHDPAGPDRRRVRHAADRGRRTGAGLNQPAPR
jgi:transcription antitermination factor NusG